MRPGFWYVALKAFNNKTGNGLNDFVDYDKFIFTEGNYPRIQFTWPRKHEEDLSAFIGAVQAVITSLIVIMGYN